MRLIRALSLFYVRAHLFFCFFLCLVALYLHRWSLQDIYLAIYWLYLADPTAVYVNTVLGGQQGGHCCIYCLRWLLLRRYHIRSYKHIWLKTICILLVIFLLLLSFHSFATIYFNLQWEFKMNHFHIFLVYWWTIIFSLVSKWLIIWFKRIIGNNNQGSNWFNIVQFNCNRNK